MDERGVRELFAQACQESGVVGAQLSITKDGQQLDLAAGLSNVKSGSVLRPDTLLQVGSVTKLFNAALLFSLLQDGLLELEAPVKYYLDDFEVADSAAASSITLKHVLSMSSGLDNGPYTRCGSNDEALAVYVGQLTTLQQHFRPGAFFGYSNAGSCIAGCIAARVGQRSWEALLRERILEPAGLGAYALLDDDLSEQTVSSGHFAVPGSTTLDVVDPCFSPTRSRAPSGSTFATTARNLAAFGKVFLDGGRTANRAELLSGPSVARMMSPQVDMLIRAYGDAWCLGPYCGDWNGVQVWGHNGTSPTSAAFLHWFPEKNGAIAGIVNTPSGMRRFSKIVLENVLEAVFGFRKPTLEAPRLPPGPISFGRYVGAYENLMVRLEVSREGGRLLGSIQSTQDGRAYLAELLPLGPDRFLVDLQNGPDEHRGVFDTAFFGDDGAGRATNALHLVFPMRRVGL